MPLYDELEGAPGAGHGLGMFGQAAAGKLNVRDEEGRISPEVIAGMTDVAGAMPMAGMPFAMKGAAGVFGGRLAESANYKMLRRAEQMEATGAKRDDIWRATGWGRDKENNWFFEIPDDKARLSKGKLLKHDDPSMLERIAGKRQGGDERAPLTLGEVYDHPTLYWAYPELRDIKVQTPSMGAGYGGGYNEQTRTIKLNRELLERRPNPYGWTPKSVLTHEIEHIIQGKEGFPGGGNPVALAERTYNDLKARAEAQPLGSPERKRLDEMLKEFKVG